MKKAARSAGGLVRFAVIRLGQVEHLPSSAAGIGIAKIPKPGLGDGTGHCSDSATATCRRSHPRGASGGEAGAGLDAPVAVFTGHHVDRIEAADDASVL